MNFVSEETWRVLFELFGEDACVKKFGYGSGNLLIKSQAEILNESLNISATVKLIA